MAFHSSRQLHKQSCQGFASGDSSQGLHGRWIGSFLLIDSLKQSHLAGNVKGLRPSQKRRLEVLLHRRHPSTDRADISILENIADESLALKQSLHMIVDDRGLCRLLWIGSLDHSGHLLAHVPEVRRRKTKDWRFISCLFSGYGKDISSFAQDVIVSLDLAPVFWLRFSPLKDSRGVQSASVWILDNSVQAGWTLFEENDLAAICKGKSPINYLDKKPFFQLVDSKERVLLLTLTGKDFLRSERDLAELEGLVRSAGADPVAIAFQKPTSFYPQTIWGIGKLKEVALQVRRENISLVIADRELTPSQARNIEQYLASPVMDRSELILDIFAQRASSAAGRLQVELAQLRYRKSRLTGRGHTLSRQGGGIGTRGPGETQLEKDRRLIVTRIERLGKDLKHLKKQRAQLRNRRKDLSRAALVGYTNAGKSSLLNALCNLSSDNQVLAENKLFATLDPTTRRLIFPRKGCSPNELLVTDTVGFIRELPAPLMEAFQATLEETLEADLLMLVVDISSPDWRFQLDTVNHLLDLLGVNSTRQVVANKIDRCESNALQAISTFDNKVIYVSATTGSGLQDLKLWLYRHFWGNSCSESQLVQQAKSQHE